MWGAPRFLTAILAIGSLACSANSGHNQRNQSSAQDIFWSSLETLCGNAYAGSATESVPPDSAMSAAPLIMHVMSCSADEIRIPFFVGENRSRTWVITRVPDGLQLKHDHRHEDGSEDAVSQYGGVTADIGTGGRQEFAADEFTAQLVPQAATNIWTLEILGNQTFAYALRRVGSDRKFRAEFDLTTPIETPLAPW